ncbi:MAG: hypothetical protein GY749_29395, partial [Desulfobacteraceae bacterium]|nr:hypothetical protein [Desulfobacteraceae bacterium]
MKKLICITSIMAIVLFFSFAASGWAFVLIVEIEGTGKVTSSDPATVTSKRIDCPDTCMVSLNEGSKVELTATSISDSGFFFERWETENSNIMRNTPSVTITMDSDITIRAVFKEDQTQPQEFTLNVGIFPEGAGQIMSDTNMINCPSTCSASFAENAEVELAANSASDSGYIFDHWKDNDGTILWNTSPATVTMNFDKTVIAVFKEQTQSQEFTMTVEVSPEGVGQIMSDPSAIECPSVCSAIFAEGTEVALTANPVPDSGYIFDYWINANSETFSDMPMIFTMNSDITGKAVFKKESQEFTMTVEVSPEGAGRITSDPSAIDCPSECSAVFAEGTEVNLTATPESGYTFKHWVDMDGNTFVDMPMNVVMDSDVTGKAVFTEDNVTPQTYPLTVSVSAGGHIRSEYGDGLECSSDSECVWNITAGETVTIKAVSDEGYIFDGWQGDVTEDGSTGYVTVDAAKAVKAVFAEDNVTPQTLPLTVLVSPGGHVRSEYGTGLECYSECVWDITAGDTVAIEAVPDEGYSFDGWQGDVTGNISIVSVTMDAEKTVNAMFGDGGVTPQTFSLTVLVSPGGHVRSEYGTGLECYSECV